MRMVDMLPLGMRMRMVDRPPLGMRMRRVDRPPLVCACAVLLSGVVREATGRGAASCVAQCLSFFLACLPPG